MFESNPGLMVIVRIVIIMGVSLILSQPVFNTLDTAQISNTMYWGNAIHATKKIIPNSFIQKMMFHDFDCFSFETFSYFVCQKLRIMSKNFDINMRYVLWNAGGPQK